MVTKNYLSGRYSNVHKRFRSAFTWRVAFNKRKENAAIASIDVKKATSEQLREYLAEVLPDFDRDRVYTNDIKKLILWYNILVSNGITDFGEETAVEAE